MTEQIVRNYIMSMMEKKFEEKLKPLDEKLIKILELLEKK